MLSIFSWKTVLSWGRGKSAVACIICWLFRSIWPRTSLAIQWLRLHDSTTEGMGSVPGRGTEIPHANWHGPRKKYMIKISWIPVIFRTKFLGLLLGKNVQDLPKLWRGKCKCYINISKFIVKSGLERTSNAWITWKYKGTSGKQAISKDKSGLIWEALGNWNHIHGPRLPFPIFWEEPWFEGWW